ncbi:hypothetical protein TNCV_2447361 [Trichonephila clavipes]|uniref:Uncharacterized protein n=1 Tax=Trichonephila clavipes TaxID=2585209 RepID=A0A8X6VMX5_TRICX|nr:hypothetical protein TNCV_2447361 [Trichonephila clavipes]
MFCVRTRNANQGVSDFDKGQIVANRHCSLSYHSIAVRVGLDPINVSRIGNRWFQDDNTESRAGSQRPLSLAVEKTDMFPTWL